MGAASGLVPRWLHFWALATVVLTLPLLLLGAEVTTRGVGMVDPSGHSHLREPTILVRQWLQGTLAERGLGYVIEHGHRLQGIVVGCFTIILALGLWFGASRRWLRWLGPAALLAIVTQGLLGVFRVDLHALMGRNLALVHGCTAQLVFALLLTIAVITSRFWQGGARAGDFAMAAAPTLRRLALATVGLVYLQLVLGGLVRHNAVAWGPRLHLLAAFVVVAASVWLLRELFAYPGRTRRESAAGLVLAAVLFAQLALGVESWLCRFHAVDAFGQPLEPFTGNEDLVRSLHYLTGSLVFAVVLLLALWVHRPRLPEPGAGRSMVPRQQQLQGVP